MSESSPTPSEASAQTVNRSFSKSRLPGIVAGAVAFALPLALYLKTLCPTIYPGDGPELTAAAWCLGVPHPTGYPLFMVLGFLFQRVGLGSPAFSMNLMCALFGALACLGVYRLQREIWRNAVGVGQARKPAYRFVSVAVALAAGAGATWWDQSTMTEVYTMMFALMAFTWSAALRLVRKPTKRGLFTLGFLSGVGFLHHQLFLVTLPLSALAVLKCVLHNRKATRSENPEEKTEYHTPPKKNSSFILHPSSFLFAFLLFLLPLCGYLYLPLRAASLPAVNSGDPRGLGGTIDHITGKQFHRALVLTGSDGSKLAPGQIPGHVLKKTTAAFRWTGDQYVVPAAPKGRAENTIETPPVPETPPGPAPPGQISRTQNSEKGRQKQTFENVRAPLFALLLSLFALTGGVSLSRSTPLGVAGLAGGIVLNLAVVAVYVIPDNDAYHVPFLMLVLNLAVVGPVRFAEIFSPAGGRGASSRGKSSRERAWIVGAALLALCGLGVRNWYPPERLVNKSQHRHAYNYAMGLLERLPPDAVVFTTWDFDIYPLWYAQVCEGARPDVAVVGANFIFSPWYAAMLRASLPEGVEIYIGDARDPAAPDAAYKWVTAFKGGMAAPHLLAGRPVFITVFPSLYPQKSELRLLEQNSLFRLKPLRQYPMPNSLTGPLFIHVYQIEDPDNHAASAVETFRLIFPDFEERMVRREKK